MQATLTAAGDERLAEFLAALGDAGRREINASDVAIVVAHPDDETIGCGAQLARWRGARIVLVTDGAPRNGADALACGFTSTAEYARARRRELEAALALAGAGTDRLVRLDVPDQEASQSMARIARRLLDLFATHAIRVAVTNAYEGGHPDHDAVAFAVHAAAALRERKGARLGVLEFPLYRQGSTGPLYQQFARAEGAPEIVVLLSPEDQARKARMIVAHVTQRAVLAPFAYHVERFRPAPAYDFTALPNGGRLLYERHDWGMTGPRWRKLAAEALAELGLGDGPC